MKAERKKDNSESEQKLSYETSVTGTQEEHKRNVFTPKFIENKKINNNGARSSNLFPQIPKFDKFGLKKEMKEYGAQKRNSKNIVLLSNKMTKPTYLATIDVLLKRNLRLLDSK